MLPVRPVAQNRSRLSQVIHHTAGEWSQSFPAHKRQHNTDDVSAVYDTDYDNDYDVKRYRGDN